MVAIEVLQNILTLKTDNSPLLIKKLKLFVYRMQVKRELKRIIDRQTYSATVLLTIGQIHSYVENCLKLSIKPEFFKISIFPRDNDLDLPYMVIITLNDFGGFAGRITILENQSNSSQSEILVRVTSKIDARNTVNYDMNYTRVSGESRAESYEKTLYNCIREIICNYSDYLDEALSKIVG